MVLISQHVYSPIVETNVRAKSNWKFGHSMWYIYYVENKFLPLAARNYSCAYVNVTEKGKGKGTVGKRMSGALRNVKRLKLDIVQNHICPGM